MGAVDLEAAEALVDIGDEARLAHLAVVDDIDTNIDLFADNVRHRFTHARIVLRIVDLFAAATRDVHRVKIRRARQTANMGRENPISAALHRVSSTLTYLRATILTPITRAHSRAYYALVA